MHDFDSLRNIVLTEDKPPLGVGRVERADSNPGLVERLQQVAERQSGVLSIAHLGVHARHTGDASDSLDGRFDLNVGADHGFHPVLLVPRQVANFNRDAHFIDGLNGGGMEDGGVRIGKFHRFPVPEVGYGRGLNPPPRVDRVDAEHVLPQHDALGLKQGRQGGGGVVAAASAQESDVAVGPFAEPSGYHRYAVKGRAVEFGT